MVTTRLTTSKCSNPFSNPLVNAAAGGVVVVVVDFYCILQYKVIMFVFTTLERPNGKNDFTKYQQRHKEFQKAQTFKFYWYMIYHNPDE